MNQNFQYSFLRNLIVNILAKYISGNLLCYCDLWNISFEGVLWTLTHLSLWHYWFSLQMCNIVYSNNNGNVYFHKIHVCLHLETNETNGWQSNCKNYNNSSNFYEPTYPSFHMVSITASTYNSSKFVQDNNKAKNI